MTTPVKILHLEDDEEDAELIHRYLTLSCIKFDLLRVDNGSDFVLALKNFLPELILSNHLTPGINSSDALKICKENNYSGPFILISKVVSDEYGASIVKNDGAYDYVFKSHLQRLPSVINRALANNKLLIENQNCNDENTENVLLLKETEKMAHLGSWQTDLTNNVIIWSDEAFRLYGYEPNETIASYALLLQHIHPEDLSFFREMISEEMLAKNDNIKFTFRIIDKKGNVKYLLNQIQVKKDEAGKPIRLTGFNLDITENVQVTKELEKRERLYKKLIEKSTDMKIIRSAEGIISYGSPSIFNILGYTIDEFMGESILKIVHPEDIPRFIEMNNSLLAKPGESFFIKERLKHKDGTYRWFEGSVTNWNEDEDIGGFVGNFRDITEKKEDEVKISEGVSERIKAEESLTKSESNLQTIFDNTDIGYLLLDTELKVVSFNHIINDWIKTANGQSLGEGMDFTRYIQNVKKDSTILGVLNSGKNGKIDYESTFTDSQGRITWYHVKYFPVPDDVGKDTGSILSLTNITAKKLAETEREAMTNDLIHRNKDLEQFAYIVSHNLRAPVANILGSSKLMKDDEIEDSERKSLLKGLDISIHKLDAVINDLNEILQVKKIMSETKQWVVFSELVIEIKSEISVMISKEHVEIVSDFSKIDGMATLKSYIRSIFLNLITNSIKYRRPDVNPIIKITAHQSANHLQLIFKDNGLGIDIVKYKDQIFGLYKRFHLKIDGKGMGLFMVKTHVETLGGTILLKSNVNEGCEFIIDFKI